MNYGDNTYFPIFECVYGSLNFSDVFFGYLCVHNVIPD